MDMIVPPFKDVAPAAIVQAFDDTASGSELRLRVSGLDQFGSPVEFVAPITMPEGASGEEKLEAAGITLREDGDKRLAAFLRGEFSQHPGDILRSHLQRDLPDYMIPSAFVELETWPLTPNKKIDRKKLPKPEIKASETDFVAPSTPTEIALAEVWSKVLNLEKVGVHDNFYDLGGHSLLAMQVVSALEKRTGVWLSPREMIFQTLRQIAAVCDSRLESDPQPEADR